MTPRLFAFAVLPLLPLLLLGACAQVAAPAPVASYRCDGGRGFRVADAPGASGAIVELEGMHFLLQAQGADACGERFGCNELTLWRRGGDARMALRSGGAYENCRRVP